MNALEIEYNKLQHQYQKDNRTLRDRVIQLEQRNQQQEKKLSILKSNQSKSVYSPTKLKGVQQHLTKDSFKQGDIVKVINNYKGQYGAIRKVYSITKVQVHLTDMRTGIPITRAFKNVKILHLSDNERNNLLQK